MLYENGFRRWKKEDVESYHVEFDQIAQKIEVDKYILKENFGPAPRKPLKKFVEPFKKGDPAPSQDMAAFSNLTETPEVFRYHHLINEFPKEFA
jgi:hypothetical protein